ncbi:caltractin, partial [Phaeodactylum tricornutum CCAP 1055/1]
LSQGEIDDLRDAFRLFDKENTQSILLKDVRDALRSIASEVDQSKKGNSNLQRLLYNSSSFPEDKTLTMDEFVELVTKPDPNDRRSEIQKVFDLFDEGRKGHINVQDLRNASTGLGEAMEEDELHEMIERTSSDGRVYLEDFERIMAKKLFS